MPINLVLILLLISILTKKLKPKISFYSLLSATGLLFLSAFPPVANWLTYPLEHQYESFSYASKPVDYIIILGCGHTSDASLPATSELWSCSLERLVEGIRIYRQNPNAYMITSGYGGDTVSNAEKVKQAAMLLGVPERKIITENFPQDTEEEAELIAPRIKGKTAVLVTNAYHMPRAVTFFKQQGVEVIPAPASHTTNSDTKREKHWGYFMPSARSLNKTTRSWYERLGQLWQWLKS
ncbi:YdcF family protein [Endozoicomonas sp. G2_1]|uniref:ElyC/SanA/YdcF family protein n=1 Tax=Endozoicomonas sp. G2_1 TaxID=2821091 RepID=UPI001ADA987B|nr:ElyC/SanA/YdcF family protein [Endozoicomonas sp. G2_1]MBO9490687.1 YdcF family protein [Endozoicomonas sp. G2_1]